MIKTQIMKTYLILLFALIFASCQNEKKNTAEKVELNEKTTETIPEKVEEERDGVKIEKEDPKVTTTFNGKYRKMVKDEPAADCNCNCVEISFEKDTEWCIVKDKIYITARSQKTGENSADLYLVGVSREENTDRPLPWKDFDTQSPIAKIAFQPDGSADINWIGFSTNGQVITDYAIYGKKTLEGKYKRE